MGDYWKCSRMGTLLCVYIDNQCTYFKNRDNMAYIAIYRASKPMSVVVVVVVVIKSQKTIGKKPIASRLHAEFVCSVSKLQNIFIEPLLKINVLKRLEDNLSGVILFYSVHGRT